MGTNIPFTVVNQKNCVGVFASRQLGPTKFPFSCVAGLGMPHRNFYCTLHKSYIFANGPFLSNKIWADSPLYR